MYCGQTVRWIKIPVRTEVGLSTGHIVLDGNPAPKKGHSHPQFLAHVYCGKTAGWIKMPLGTEVGLSPGDTVFDEYPAALHKNGHSTPANFRPMSIVTKTIVHLSNCSALVAQLTVECTCTLQWITVPP